MAMQAVCLENLRHIVGILDSEAFEMSNLSFSIFISFRDIFVIILKLVVCIVCV